MDTALPDGSRLEFGVATASYQIEGAPEADGKTPSIWDTFTQVPGAVDDGSDGSVACASYPDPGPDIDLVAGLGVRWYRFSLAWPRIVPDGGSEVNKLGLDYYERLVDGLLERDITPMATLYHWDLPQSLEDRGGWLVRETAERFADYAMAVHDRLGDRVRLWATLNEPWCSAYLGYGSGRHAPGKQVGGEAHRAAHHLLLGHGLASARLHEGGADSVGIVLNLTPVLPETEAAAEATDGVDAIRNRIWLGPLVDGEYDAGTLRVAPVLEDPTWSVPATSTLSADRPTGWASTTTRPRGWRRRRWVRRRRGRRRRRSPPSRRRGLPVRAPLPTHRHRLGDPRRQPRAVAPSTPTTAPGLPLVVTENGAAYADDTVLPDGSVDDADRIDYLRSHLAAIDAARTAGADVAAGWCGR